MLSRLAKNSYLQRAGAWVLGAYLGFCARTCRWTVEGGEQIATWAAPGPVVVAFWHECLPLMPAMWLQARALNPARAGVVLVSRHRDGRFIGTIMARFGIAVTHGSKAKPGRTEEKGGVAALRALLKALASGQAVVMTPDGPRGPARVAAGGMTALAAISGAPVVAAAARMRPCVRLKTWDRMILPLPFARGVLVCGLPVLVARDGAAAALPGLQAALNDAAARAEALCAR